MEQKLIFKKIDGIVIDDVNQYVKNWILKNPHGNIIIGCDSQSHGKQIKYSILIVMHRKDKTGQGHGAHLILSNVWVKRINKSQLEEMPSKLWREAEFALQAAELLGKDEFFKKTIEVHLDFNSIETEKSNIVYTSGLGLLSGYGYKVFGKPFAKIASNSCDHFCR